MHHTEEGVHSLLDLSDLLRGNRVTIGIQCFEDIRKNDFFILIRHRLLRSAGIELNEVLDVKR